MAPSALRSSEQPALIPSLIPALIPSLIPAPAGAAPASERGQEQSRVIPCLNKTEQL